MNASTFRQEVLSTLDRSYGLPPGPTQPLGGGEETAVWRLDSTSLVVVHVSLLWREAAELASIHHVIERAAQRLPEANAPLPTRQGQTFVGVAGRLVTVYPFIAGQFLDRTDPRARDQAAHLLARLHKALRPWQPATPRPAPGALSPWRWNRADDPAELRDPELDCWWAEAMGRPLRHGVTHGDYWRQNMLVAQGHIVGLIDWHEAAVQPLVCELASALWEFGHHGDEITLNEPWAHAFLAAYVASGGPVPPREFDLLPAAIRWRVRRDTRYMLHTSDRRDPATEAYVQLQYARFQALASARLA